MKIRIASLLEGAERAEGTAVIIDVFRAFTTAAVAFSRGADKIVLVSEVSEALDLRRRGLADLCVGEVGGVMPGGFDLGNSPHQLSTANVEGKTIAQRTSAGTAGATAAAAADGIYAGALVNAGATARALLRDGPELVTLVAMGDDGLARTDEDEQCALYIRNILQGAAPDHAAVRSLVLSGGHSRKYEDPKLPHFHPGDRDIALRIDEFPFAIAVRPEEGLLVARAENV